MAVMEATTTDTGLRPYQTEAVEAIWQALQQDSQRCQVLSTPMASGKTVIGAAAGRQFLEEHSLGRVLWLAPSWELIAQASSCQLDGRSSWHGTSIRRIGGAGTAAQALPGEGDASVYFSTLHTWCRQWKKKAVPMGTSKSPLLVVVDECHYAAEARMGQTLLKHYLSRAWMLGLSATPKLCEKTHNLAYSKVYADLCPEYLAVPQLREVRTEVAWQPNFTQGEVSSQSLAQLGKNDDRNHRIVREYLEGHNAGYYTRTVMFACNVAHAETLNRLLAEAGVSCRTLHSKLSLAEQTQVIEAFRSGTIDVLVAVTMLTEGFDVPEIDAVFLVRPTASRTLLLQMVGRGARLTPQKRSFLIVEFTDNVERLGGQLFHAAQLQLCPKTLSQRSPGKPVCHTKPTGIPHFEHLTLPGLECVTFVRDQTFGVEIELGAKQGAASVSEECWSQVAREIIACLSSAAHYPVHGEPLGYHENSDFSKWRVCRDSSAGWEVVSPVLVNQAGFDELSRICEAVEELVDNSKILTVNIDCGLHVTLATGLDTDERLRGFLARLTRLEPGLYPLVAPSRYYQALGNYRYNRRRRNKYCRAVRELLRGVDGWDLCDQLDLLQRYSSVNLSKVSGQARLLEVRMHHGTTEARKIIPWISLWMHLFNRSRYDWQGELEPGIALPGGNTAIARRRVQREDIFALLRDEGIILPSAFEDLLRQRRLELRKAWRRVVPKRVAAWERDGWFEQPDHGPFAATRRLWSGRRVIA